MNKPQDYYGMLWKEESFSEYTSDLYDMATEKMSDPEKAIVRDLMYLAYKEGYVDATEKILFMMKK